MSRQRTLETASATAHPPVPLIGMHRESTAQPRFFCATCGIEVREPTVFHAGLAFCCAGCFADGPCTCSYDGEPGTSTVGTQPSTRPARASLRAPKPDRW